MAPSPTLCTATRLAARKHVRLNGTEVGEYGLNGALAGYYGVPVAFVAGDAAFVTGARGFFPMVNALAVKDGIGYNAAARSTPWKRGNASRLESCRIDEAHCEAAGEAAGPDYARGGARRSVAS